MYTYTQGATQCNAMQLLLQLKSLSMVLLLIVKKAIEKTGVQARTLRRDKLDAFVQTRAHTCMHAAACTHTHCTLYGVLLVLLQYHLNFLHGEDLSSFSRLFQQGTHDFKGQNHGWPAGAPGAGSLFASTYRPI